MTYILGTKCRLRPIRRSDWTQSIEWRNEPARFKARHRLENRAEIRNKINLLLRVIALGTGDTRKFERSGSMYSA